MQCFCFLSILKIRRITAPFESQVTNLKDINNYRAKHTSTGRPVLSNHSDQAHYTARGEYMVCNTRDPLITLLNCLIIHILKSSSMIKINTKIVENNFESDHENVRCPAYLKGIMWFIFMDFPSGFNKTHLIDL